MSAFAGAAAALAGVVISELMRFMRERSQRRHARAVLLREKYEELARLHNDSLRWMDRLLAAQGWEEFRSLTQAEAARHAYVLALIYFPKLKGPLEDYLTMCLDFQLCLQKAFKSSVPASAGAQAESHDEVKFTRVCEEVRAQRQRVDEALQANATAYAVA